MTLIIDFLATRKEVWFNYADTGLLLGLTLGAETEDEAMKEGSELWPQGRREGEGELKVHSYTEYCRNLLEQQKPSS